jgi:CRISPR/Cas system-associated protein Cas5 (RAMP superfamily)
MDITITWPIAITVVGSVATVCLTIYQILAMRKDTKKIENVDSNKEQTEQVIECQDKFAKIEKDVAVVTTKFEESCKNNKEDMERLEKSVDKLADIAYDTLVKLAQEHSDDKNK